MDLKVMGLSELPDKDLMGGIMKGKEAKNGESYYTKEDKRKRDFKLMDLREGVSKGGGWR